MAVAPVTEVSTAIYKLDIAYPKIEFIKSGVDHTFNFHVYNSTGFPEYNATCGFHLYDRSGHHIYENESVTPEENLIDYQVNLGGGNLTELGIHTYIVYCNTSTEGGFVSTGITINGDGKIETVDSSGSISIVIFILIIAIGLFALPFFKPDFVKYKNKYFNEMINLIFKRACWVISMFLMMMNAAIVATIAVELNLGVTRELYRYMFFLGYAGYLFAGFMIINTIFKVMKLWKMNIQNKRMGDDDD